MALDSERRLATHVQGGKSEPLTLPRLLLYLRFRGGQPRPGRSHRTEVNCCGQASPSWPCGTSQASAMIRA